MKTKEQYLIESVLSYVDLLSTKKEDEQHIDKVRRITAENIGSFIRSNANIYEVDLNEPLPFGNVVTNDEPAEYSHIPNEMKTMMNEVFQNRYKKD